MIDDFVMDSLVMVVHFIHSMVTRDTGNRESGFRFSKIGISLFLEVRIIGFWMIVRRSAVEEDGLDMFVGMDWCYSGPNISSVVAISNRSNAPFFQYVSPRCI